MPPVVVLDACVLYPAAQRDFFMWLAAGGVIRAHWTNEIHDEWMRNVERDYGIARSILEHVRTLMDRAAGDALIRHYRQHEHLFTKTDAKDRHVAAAAVASRKRSRADIVTIITWNLRDFDHRELAKVGVAAETPDAFLCRLFAKSPDEVIAALVRMQNNLRKPSKTVRECTDTLAMQGLKNFAELISGSID
jgi:hypothetical protein